MGTTTVTIQGANTGPAVTINATSGTNATLVQQVATSILTAAALGTKFDAVLDAGTPPTLPGGDVGVAYISASVTGGTFAMPAGYDYLIDASTAAITITGTTAADTLVANGGTLVEASGLGDELNYAIPSGTPITVANPHQLISPVGSSLNISVTGTSDTVIATGAGDVISFNGSDNVQQKIAGNGAFIDNGSSTVKATVQAQGADLVVGGIANMVVNGGSLGEQTVVAGSGFTQVFGSTLGQEVIGNASSGGHALDVAGGTGNETVYGGANTLVFFAGAGSNNEVFFGSSANYFVAGGGSDTVFTNGSGGVLATNGSNELVEGQTNNIALIAEVGSTTINALTAGADDFYVANSATAAVNTTLVGNTAGTDSFIFFDGTQANNILIQNYQAGDQLLMSGYGYSTSGDPTPTLVSGSLTFTLADNTTITLQNYTGHVNIQAFG